jgi:general transcription factor 3C polypeptide 3 (transcription factor C subunit 4)
MSIEQKEKIRLLMLALSVYSGNALRISISVRYFINAYPDSPHGVRLYSLLIPPGHQGIEVFKMKRNEKFIRRQTVSTGEEMKRTPSKMAQITHAHTNLVLGHIRLVTRSVGVAITKFLQVFDVFPNDPLVCLTLAVSYLSIAMQSRSENRHEHIIRGLSFLCRYERLCLNSEESNYNFARAFQHLGNNFIITL